MNKREFKRNMKRACEKVMRGNYYSCSSLISSMPDSFYKSQLTRHYSILYLGHYDSGCWLRRLIGTNDYHNAKIKGELRATMLALFKEYALTDLDMIRKLGK